jgi:hypothetical protein
MERQTLKKITAVALVGLFVITLTASAVSAPISGSVESSPSFNSLRSNIPSDSTSTMTLLGGPGPYYGHELN